MFPFVSGYHFVEPSSPHYTISDELEDLSDRANPMVDGDGVVYAYETDRGRDPTQAGWLAWSYGRCARTSSDVRIAMLFYAGTKSPSTVPRELRLAHIPIN
ncbi:hypothetical protein R3P38DRAFT_3184791, partial [Favolaschia claudopus]